MTIRNYMLCELVGTIAYWISPRGETMEVVTNHIESVIANPEKFDMTRKEIEDTYHRHGEKMGAEGKAREEIIKKLVGEGWIRIRRYKNEYSINIEKMTKKIKDILYSWAERLLGSGIKGMKESDPYMPVKIVPLSGGVISMDINDIANDKLYNEGEHFDRGNKIYIVE